MQHGEMVVVDEEEQRHCGVGGRRQMRKAAGFGQIGPTRRGNPCPAPPTITSTGFRYKLVRVQAMMNSAWPRSLSLHGYRVQEERDDLRKNSIRRLALSL